MHGPTRSALFRYGAGCVAAAVGVGLCAALLPVTDSPTLAPLIAAAAFTVWLAGIGPALLCIALSSVASVSILLEPRGSLDLSDTDNLAQWLVNLAVSLVVVALAELLRLRRERATEAAELAQATADEMARLQDVAARLSSVATTPEIAHVLVTRMPGLIGARGGAVGMITGDELVVVDPHGGALETHRPGSRLPLTTLAPIARASEGRTVVVHSREEFEHGFPDGAAMTPFAQAAIAAPLRARGEVAGTMSFLFDRPQAVTQRVEALVEIAADLGGQAFERALLYEREVDTRLALDRLVRVAPRFHAEDPETVVQTICREARRTFESDFGVLWRLDGDRLRLVASDPASDVLPDGLEASLSDFPDLHEAVGDLRVSFVEDVQREAHGAGLDLVRNLGLRSSMRVPIAVDGQPERLLSISWKSIVPEPSAPTTLVARRFADQAGLALEQLERRRAEAEARQRAEEARRLHAVTAVLAAAATSAEVAEICLEHSLAATSAKAGFVALRAGSGPTVDIAARRGLPRPASESWLALAEHELSQAIPGRGERMRLRAEVPTAEVAAAWDVSTLGLLTHAMESSGETLGVLVLVFPAPPRFAEETGHWLRSVVSQCAQAFERTRLLDEEKRQRERAERLQRMTTRLSGALSLSDVAEVTVDEAGRAAEASGAALFSAHAERGLLSALAWNGYDPHAVEPWLELPLDRSSPGGDAVRRRRRVYFDSPEALRAAHPAFAGTLLASGHTSFFFIPLVVGRDAKGVLMLSWRGGQAVATDQLALVEALAAQAAQAVDRASHFEWERSVAETLQRSVLPGSLPEIDGVNLAARYLPGTAGLEVGGDWYDAITLPDGRLGLVVGDVVGKGVVAASTMAQLRNGLRAFSLDRLKPSSALARLNRLAYEVLENPFATAAYAVLDPQSGVCRIASAGHPPPLVRGGDGRVEFVEARGLPLGAMPDTSYTQEVIELPPGALLLLYTDGLVERRDQSIDDGLAKLREAVADAPPDLEGLVDHLIERLVGGAERGDDIAILAVQLLPVAPQPFRLRVPLRTESARHVRDALRAWLAGTPLDGERAEDVVLSVWEACANAVEHGSRSGGSSVVVEAEMTDSTVRVRVEDDGGWTPPLPDRERGLGLRLMRSLMSSTKIARTRKGTKVTLEREIATSR